MDLTALYILRQLFVFCLVLGVVQETRSFDYSKEPDNPFFVVEGVNSTRVKLQWEFSLTSSESVAIITVRVGKPGEESVIIGGKSGPNGVYKVEDVMKDKYELEEPATLVIKTVTRNEDGNRYIFRVVLQGEFNPRESSTSLEVFVPAEFTLSPVQTTDVDIGKNVTLYCNASGDPHPNITWTKDGIPSRTFNFSGPVLHLPNVQRKDVGSYRCSAFNGYGPVISKVGLVNVKCPQRKPETVEITLTRSWKDAFGITSSVEYRDLSVKVTSEILAVYAEMSTLCRVQVVAFRSGSVRSRVELVFQSGTDNPLQPLEDEIKDRTLGTISVENKLIINPTPATVLSYSPATTKSRIAPATVLSYSPATTKSRIGSSSTLKTQTGSSCDEQKMVLHGVYLACIALLLLVIMILLVILWRMRRRPGLLQCLNVPCNVL